VSTIAAAPCGTQRCLRCGPADAGVPDTYWPPASLVLAWAAEPTARRAPGADLDVRWSMRGLRLGEPATFLIDVRDGLPVHVLAVCSEAVAPADVGVEASVGVTVAVLAGLVPGWALYRDAAVTGDLDGLRCFTGVFDSSGYRRAVAPFRAEASAFVAGRVAIERAAGSGPGDAFVEEVGR
jgi:hypothetical protein